MPLYRPPSISWTDVAFGAGVSNYGSVYPTCQYWKDPFGIVHLKGLLAGPAGSGVTLFTMPVGYRPAALEIFANLASYSAGQIGFRINLSTTGVMSSDSASGVTWAGTYLSIEGFTYHATQ